MSKNLLLGLGLGSFALWHIGLKYLYAAKRLQYKIDSVRVIPTSTSTMQVQLNLLVYNPTHVTILMSSFHGQVSLNGTLVGVANTPIARTIGANGITQFTITLDVDNATLFSQISSDILSTLWQQWYITIAGNIIVQNINVPINITLTPEAIVNG